MTAGSRKHSAYKDRCKTPFLLHLRPLGCKIVKAPPLILCINIITLPIFRYEMANVRDESEFCNGLRAHKLIPLEATFSCG
jgi:hypothetical protein